MVMQSFIELRRARSLRRRVITAAAAAVVGLALPALAGAQTQEDEPTGRRGFLTRQELETLAAQAERAGGEKRSEAQALRQRLQDGDFKVGDKIVLRTESTVPLPEALAQSLNDTVVVREGRVIRIPNIPDIPLAGVLRSELDAHLNKFLSAYVRQITVRGEPLVQVLVSGAVGRPGYYPLVPDMLVADALSQAGTGGNTDLTRSSVKRAGQEIIDRDSLQAAIRAGATLDRMDLRTGDELVVGERKQWNWMTVLQIVSAVTGLALVIISLSDR